MEQKNLLQLKNQGSIAYVHCDAYHIWVVYEDYEAEKDFHVCLLKMDKALTIVSAMEVTYPDGTPYTTEDMIFERWGRPQLDEHQEPVFRGIVSRYSPYENGQSPVETYHRFEIRAGVFHLGDVIENFESRTFPPLECLGDVEVDLNVQKNNQLYVAGLDHSLDCQFFAQVNLRDMRCVRLLHLRLPGREVVVKSISIDHHEGRIYLGGKSMPQSSTEELHLPYWECVSMDTIMLPTPTPSSQPTTALNRGNPLV